MIGRSAMDMTIELKADVRDMLSSIGFSKTHNKSATKGVKKPTIKRTLRRLAAPTVTMVDMSPISRARIKLLPFRSRAKSPKKMRSTSRRRASTCSATGPRRRTTRGRSFQSASGRGSRRKSPDSGNAISTAVFRDSIHNGRSTQWRIPTPCSRPRGNNCLRNCAP